jgi:hypothetical protein
MRHLATARAGLQGGAKERPGLNEAPAYLRTPHAARRATRYAQPLVVPQFVHL